MDVEVPKIKEAFVKTMVDKYNATEEHAREIIEPFMQVFIDSANYGFSINHSEAYSCISYIMGWLRYHYPLEFLTACLNANIGKEDKINKLIEYAKSQGVNIKPINYGFSKADYMFDKEEYAIYQGVEGIKYLNEQVGNGLYEFKQKYGKHENFFDFLIDLEDGIYYSDGIYESIEEDEEEWIAREIFPPVESMSALRVLKGGWEEVLTYEKMKKIGYVNDKGFSINSRQMKILISLNYFKEFGENKTLLEMYEFYDKNYKVSHKLKTKLERYKKLMSYYDENSIEQKKLSLNEQSVAEMDYLGHVVTIREDMKKNVYFVTSITKNKQNVRIFAYQYATGNAFEFKASNRVYNLTPVMGGDIIEIQDISIKPKTVKVGDSWVKSPTEKTFWVEQMKYIRKNRG